MREEPENNKSPQDTDFTANAYEDKAEYGGGRWRGWAVAGAVGLLVLGLLGFYLWRRANGKTEQAAAEPAAAETGKVKFLMEQQWLIQMRLAKAEEQTVARQITATGRVVPAANSQAAVAPPVGGILLGPNLPRMGQFVGAGQNIAVVQQTATSAEAAQIRAANAQVRAADAQTRAQILSQNLQVQAQNAQAQIENARLEADKRANAGEVDRTRVRLEQAKREAERARRLFEGKVLAQKQMQAAESEQSEAQAVYNAAVKRRDALASARPVAPLPTIRENAPARAERLNADASYTVRAPFGGYVTKVSKANGEQVAPGEAIIEISNLDTVWVEAPIFERDLNALGVSRTATFTVAAYKEEFKGAVLDIGAVIDEQTRAAKVIFQVNNSGRALRLGMQANVRLEGEEAVTAMMIPKEAVLEAEGKKLVYVLLSGEEFERREVILGDEYGGKVAVLSGVQAGERVVTQGAYQIRLQELRPADAGVHSHET